MTEKELYKQFDEDWKKKNEGKYLVWLIAYFGSFVLLAIGAIPMLTEGVSDSTVSTFFVCFIAFFAAEIVAAVINRQKKKDWKAYREKEANNEKHK